MIPLDCSLGDEKRFQLQQCEVFPLQSDFPVSQYLFYHEEAN